MMPGYSASLSRIIALLFNALVTKHSLVSSLKTLQEVVCMLQSVKYDHRLFFIERRSK